MSDSNRLLPWPAILVAAVLALLASACGNSSSSAGSGGSPNAGAGSNPQSAVVYSDCMRSHGVTQFPDPSSSGEIPKPQVVDARNSNPARFDAATTACERLLPSGGQQPTISPADQADYLRAAACMRSHGFPAFPDPTFPDGHLTFTNPPGLNQDSVQFKHAAGICTKLIPAGLPDSSASGQ